jgi:hypothetical protein
MKRLLAFGALALALGGAGTLVVSNAHAQTSAGTSSASTTQKDVSDTPEANDTPDATSTTTKDVPEVGDTQD